MYTGYTNTMKPQWGSESNQMGSNRIDLKPSGVDGQHECSREIVGGGNVNVPAIQKKVKPKQIRICSKQGKNTSMKTAVW